MRYFLLCQLFVLILFSQNILAVTNFNNTVSDSGALRKRHFYLQNTLNIKRSVPLPPRSVNVLFKEMKKDTGELSRLTTAECMFDSIIGDSARVRLFAEETEIEYLNFFTNISTSYFEGSYDRAFKNIGTKSIQYINMKTPFRHAMSRVGGVIMSLSILTIVTTPLAGMQLNTAERASLRNQVFLTGISGFVVAIPFFVIGKNKKYGLSQEYETSKRNYWVLKQRFE